MGLVVTWLHGIGLQYAVPSFVAAGIDNPSALAQLDVNHFEALGVTDPEDRRKLFFLVQRIKMACNDQQENDTSMQEVDTVLAQTMGPSLHLDANQVHKQDVEMSPRRFRKSLTPKNNNNNNSSSTTNANLNNSFPSLKNNSNSHDFSFLDQEDSVAIVSESSEPEESTTTTTTINNINISSTAKKKTSPSNSTKKKTSPNVTSRRTRKSTIESSDSESDGSTTRRSFLQQPRSVSVGRRQSAGQTSAGSTAKPRSASTTKAGRAGLSLRTGKRLSSIPANTALPMSPLPPTCTPRKSRREGALSQSLTESSRNNSSTPTTPMSTTTTTTARSTLKRSSSFGGGRVSVQGRKLDTSFKAQIAKMREDNNREYELHGSPANDEDDDTMRIRVMVRKRPMSRSEITAAGDVDVIHPLDHGSYGRLLVYNPKTKVDLTKSIETLPFCFDNVFDENSTNVQIYERAIRSLIPNLFQGQWASIFAYGQTGSGKTFTMMGSNATGSNEIKDLSDMSNLGLYYMAALDLFQAIETPGFDHYRINASLFEIYGGKLFDLLNGKNQIKCLEDSSGRVCFPGLSEHEVHSADELIELIDEGSRNRSTGSTSRNADSSRSHAVLQLHLHEPDDGEFSRLTFIDLAGSERGADTATASRATRLEGSDINTSLLALKEVIRALATGDSMAHVPFRGSRLTQVLKESFVGPNSQSVMIACVSPNIGNVEPTLNTLRYADRVKERNAETGELSAAVKARQKPATAQQARPRYGLRRNNSIDTDTSGMLDELLASPRNDRPPVVAAAENSRQIAQRLVTAHKAAMSEMLAMVKDEMTIVNQADSDQEGLREYVAQLNTVHEQQLSLIATLREHLLAYRLAQSDQQHPNAGDDDDDSFEDLRD